jgi:geranylgeranyl diphosphate synthase, type II
VLAQIKRLVSRRGWGSGELDELVLDYPLRSAKALRPSICLATSRALGGNDDAVLPTAAVIELLHNAFLVHDDVEDESWFRRGEDTLQRARGLPVAVNVGDAMLVLALAGLLDNLELLGLRLSLQILQSIVDMLRVTVAGQAMELAWIRDNQWQFAAGTYREAYEDMVFRKTAKYSFVVPVEIACIAAGVDDLAQYEMLEFARHVGIAFQIADDLLNLSDDANGYGKEPLGDLWEGKRTLMLLHALHVEASRGDLRPVLAALGRRRPAPTLHGTDDFDAVAAAIEGVTAGGHIDREGRARLLTALRRTWHSGARDEKTDDDVRMLHALILRNGGVEYAREVAHEHVGWAISALERCRDALAPGEASELLRALPRYVTERLR